MPLAAAVLDPFADQAAMAFDRIISINFARNWKGADPAIEAKLEPLSAAALARGRAMDNVAFMEADMAQVAVAYGLWQLFDTVDVLLVPMLSTAAPKLGAFPTDHADIAGHFARMRAFAPFASLANAAGTPALTLPHGLDADGLPLPVQLIGPMGSDGLLLRLARQLEAERPWTYATTIAGWPG